MVFFPGLPDHDAVDTAVVAWAKSVDEVLAVTRCWSQARDGDRTRLRVYGVIIGDLAMETWVRDKCADAARRGGESRMGIEVMAPRPDMDESQLRLLEGSVVLWEDGGAGARNESIDRMGK